VLVLAISLALLSHIVAEGNYLPAAVLGVAAAFGLTCIDLFYVANGVINIVYLYDAVPEMLFIVTWLYLAWRVKRLADRRRKRH
jgi:hypothetical protein